MQELGHQEKSTAFQIVCALSNRLFVAPEMSVIEMVISGKSRTKTILDFTLINHVNLK